MFRFILSVLLYAYASARSPEKPSIEVWFHVLGDRRGEVEPCSCPRIQLGGLQRLVAFVEQGQKQRHSERVPLFVDTGNTYFPLPELPETRKEQAVLKAELIADAYRQIGVEFQVPGSRDFALGLAPLKTMATRSGVSLVAANIADKNGTLLFQRVRYAQKQGIKIAVTGLVEPATRFAETMDAVVLDAKPAAEAALREMREQGAQVRVLISQDPAIGANLKGLGFDLVLTPPAEEGKGFGVRAWGVGERKVVYTRDYDLLPEWNQSTSFSARYDRYLAQIRGKAVAQDTVEKPAATVVQNRGAFVAQAGKCRQCHQKQHDFWAATKHASAYLVLFSKNQHFDPECIGCHSVGFQQPGGFNDITAPIRLFGQTPRKKGEKPFVEVFMEEIFAADVRKGPLDSRKQPERHALLHKSYIKKVGVLQSQGKLESLHMGVQCEHCHGNRSSHPGSGLVSRGKVKASKCLQCHVPPHDESFDFKKMGKRVACPLR